MSEPKILILDIETTPILAWTWGLWKQDIYIDRIVIPTRMTCFAAKWYGEKRTMFYSEFDPKNPRSMFHIGGSGLPEVAPWVHEPHVAMVQKAVDLLDEADAVVHFNGKSFDVPHIYRECLEYGVELPSHFGQIDLIAGAKQARFASNKLEWVSRQIGLEGKANDGGFQTWLGVMAGDPTAMRRFARYNRRDVTLLEPVFEEMRPLLKGIPNYNLFVTNEHGELVAPERPLCPKCGSNDIQMRGPVARTSVSGFRKFYCKTCHCWSREGKRAVGADLRGVPL